MDNYTITSPISGSVISKTVKAGDTIDNADGNTVLAVVADMSQMTFDISVDELDVASLKEGQTVNITADALENQTFTGSVSNIGLLGTTSNGVTTYPVTIMIDNPKGLWPGMNLTADIVTESAKNVLNIPVGAVSRGNLVLVKGTASDTSDASASSAPGTAATSAAVQSPSGKSRAIDRNSAPDGYYYKQVTLGINDDTNIEVTSGLSVGDIVAVPVTKAAAATSTTQTTMGGGGMAGGGGGAPPAGM